MNLSEFFELVWRRKLIVAAITLIVFGGAIGVLRLIDPQYEATSTIALRPTTDDDVVFFSFVDAVVPVYADAATSRITRERARARIGHPIGTISVKTFAESPIIRIRARDTDAERARESAQAITDVVLQRAGGGDVGVPGVAAYQLDPAARPADPVYPRPALTLAVALLMGLALGIGAALLRENLTTTIETPEALARIAGVPSFGEIPPEPAIARLHSPQELAHDTRYRVVAEAFRGLRTNLLFTRANLRSIVVTSPEGSHGKTTVAFGLAVSFARSGARTLLVDADLRRGRISELLNVQRTPGLSEILLGHPVETAIRHTSLETLDFLTGGRLGEDPGELLMSEFPSLLHQFERMYDMVVIDTTPLVPVSDARILARFAKASLVVASAGATTRRQLRTAIERLSLISVQPTAVVLNNYKAPTKDGYYGVVDAQRNGGEQLVSERRSTTGV